MSDHEKDLRDTEEDAPLVPSTEEMLRELSRRREAKELSPHDFDLNFIFQLNQIGAPLTRRDLNHKTGTQAVVVTRDDLEALGCLDFIHYSGERMLIGPESLQKDSILVLYPEDLGEMGER